MPASSETRIGVVGLGQMGRYHTQAYRAAGVNFLVGCDADPARAAAFGREHDLPTCNSFDELLAVPGLSALSICTPPHLHLPMVRAALEAGLDILCEKPLASTLRDGRAVLDLIPAERIVMLCFFHRFHEPIVRLRAMLAAGELGQPRFLRNRFALDMSADRRPWVWDPSQAGGGAVLNTSVHSIDLFRFLIGEPERVVARMRPNPTESTLERDAVLLLEAARGGPAAVLEALSDAVEREFALTLETDEAIAEVGWNPPSLRIRRHGADRWTAVGISAPSALTRIQAGVDHFLSCVLERRQPGARVADGVRALEVAQAAYQSVVEDSFVACGPGGVSRSRGCSANG
jgi:predicted dehydrogenase